MYRLETAGLDALPRQVAAAALEVALAGATATAQDARRRVETQVGTGVHYPGLPNQSSAPGESPVNQTGDLLGTIGTDQDDILGIGAAAVAGDGSGKALALEAGTSNMEPRPFLGPAAEVGRVAAETKLIEVGKTLGRV